MRCIICSCEGFEIAFAGVKDFEYETYQPVDHGRCPRCGVIAQYPLPHSSVIQTFYPPNYRNYQPDSQHLFSFFKKIEEYGLVRRLANIIGDNQSANILEIGCGSGSLLRALQKRGFKNLSGSDFRTSSRQERGIRFVRGDIEARFPYEERFDVIIMINVIEHLLDPVEALRKCRDHLFPGGKIIVMTPNAGSLALSLFGKYWAGFHAPRHIFLFNRKSLKKISKDIGLDQVICHSTVEPGEWSISIQNILQDAALGKTKLQNGLAWYTNVLSILLMPVAILQNLTPKCANIFCVFQKAG